jgi:SET domain-containing protein
MDGVPVPPSDVWLDDRLEVRSSPIEGHGLFATDPIPAGTVVIRFGGRLVSSAQLDALIAAADADPAGAYVDTITIGDDAHLVMPAGTDVHFGNHSCDPTMWHVSAYEVATRRELREGDEATVDYATDSGADGFEIVCNCGTAICRGVVTSHDWRQPELQQRYDGHWVPAMQRLIQQQ